jgi:uncharacterized damage-inducible protein DinB
MTVAKALLQEANRQLLEESWPRLLKAVPELSEEELWDRVNSQTNSVGNLLLHLNGNVRQWVLAGLGRAPDSRQRSKEFSERGPIASSELLARLEKTLKEASDVIEGLDEERLLETRRIQGYDINGVRALVHVVEHFSYHVGQITHMVKALKSIDLGYYEGQDLEQHNETPDG